MKNSQLVEFKIIFTIFCFVLFLVQCCGGQTSSKNTEDISDQTPGISDNGGTTDDDETIESSNDTPETNPASEEDCTAADQQTYYLDADGDGYGDSATTIVDCAQPSGYIDNQNDCDDTDSNINPSTIDDAMDDDDTDANCDGVDGILSEIIFVDANTPAADIDQDGSLEKAYATIDAALADGSGKSIIYVIANGAPYVAPATIDGYAVYGGFSVNTERDTVYRDSVASLLLSQNIELNDATLNEFTILATGYTIALRGKTTELSDNIVTGGDATIETLLVLECDDTINLSCDYTVENNVINVADTTQTNLDVVKIVSLVPEANTHTYTVNFNNNTITLEQADNISSFSFLYVVMGDDYDNVSFDLVANNNVFNAKAVYTVLDTLYGVYIKHSNNNSAYQAQISLNQNKLYFTGDMSSIVVQKAFYQTDNIIPTSTNIETLITKNKVYSLGAYQHIMVHVNGNGMATTLANNLFASSGCVWRCEGVGVADDVTGGVDVFNNSIVFLDAMTSSSALRHMYGIYFDDSHAGSVENNLIDLYVGNDSSTTKHYAVYQNYGPTGRFNSFDNNFIYLRNTANLNYFLDNTCNGGAVVTDLVTLNTCTTSTATSFANNIGETDPLLVDEGDPSVETDPSTLDFSLGTSSPLVDAGKNIVSVIDDVDSFARSEGYYDIGAYEQQ